VNRHVLPRRHHGRANGAPPGERPQFGDEYVEWLERTWRGDVRELREGRYLHLQGDLKQTFEVSEFWRQLCDRLDQWSERYEKENEAPLFHAVPQAPRLLAKPWESFLSRTWRENVGSANKNWPSPPEGGWWLPDCWYERAWDIVRTRIVVRYLDGVTMLADEITKLANQRRFGLRALQEREDKETGYYAIHVIVQHPFVVPALDYTEAEHRSSGIEIQVMTTLAEVISQLTHVYYEDRRDAASPIRGTIWDEDRSEEIAEDIEASALWEQSQAVEHEVMKLRKRIRERTAASSRRRKNRV
jgi:ppGpp synthetase/RelA/SpoT-type nucleotidyltranferase